jgi:hypothetical protein
MTSSPPTRAHESGNRRLRCVLAIPAHNKQDALVECLDSIAAASLPRGATWQEWVLLDDGSTDNTVARWGAWGVAHPALSLRVQTTPSASAKRSAAWSSSTTRPRLRWPPACSPDWGRSGWSSNGDVKPYRGSWWSCT